MSEYLTKEEIRKWRSSLERITLEEYAARLGKIIQEEKHDDSLVDSVILKSLNSMTTEPYTPKAEKIQSLSIKSFSREKELRAKKEVKQKSEKNIDMAEKNDLNNVASEIVLESCFEPKESTKIEAVSEKEEVLTVKNEQLKNSEIEQVCENKTDTEISENSEGTKIIEKEVDLPQVSEICDTKQDCDNKEDINCPSKFRDKPEGCERNLGVVTLKADSEQRVQVGWVTPERNSFNASCQASEQPRGSDELAQGCETRLDEQSDIDNSKEEVLNFSFNKTLTSREQTVFDHFLANKNTIVYAKDLANLLCLPRDYVYKYIKNLRSKLKEDILQNAENGGYILKV